MACHSKIYTPQSQSEILRRYDRKHFDEVASENKMISDRGNKLTEIIQKRFLDVISNRTFL